MTDNSPKWTRYAPAIAGVGYFAYSYWYSKEGFKKSALWSLAVALVAFIPWLHYTRQANMPAITSTAGASGSATPVNQDISNMSKQGRQAAIDYIISREKATGFLKTDKNPNAAAYANLTNNELKALYLTYKFLEHKDDFEPGKIADDAGVKKIALEKFGIETTGISSVKNDSSVAIAKIGKFYSTQLL